MQFRNDIQGLRAVAVVLVFLFHLNTNILTGGFIGVDVFFVISGYLVSNIILHKIESGKFNLIEFYIGRFKRLLPVYLFFLISILLVGGIVYLNLDINGLKNNVFHSLLFNSNNYLASLDNYFGAKSSENPLLHTWTLSIEMQFYFLLPLFLLLIRNKRYLFIITVLIVLGLLGYSYFNSTYLNNKNLMYFSFISRFPEFLIGLIFGLKENEIKKIIGNYKSVIGIICLMLIIGSGFFISESSNFPGFLVLVPCLSTGTLLVLNENVVNQKILNNKVLVHIGEISYSVYLWHWSIMALIRYYNADYNFNLIESIAIITITYFLSLFSYSFIESKFRKFSNKKFFITTLISILLLMFFYVNITKVNNYFSAIPIKYSKPSFGMNSHASSFKNVEVIGSGHLDKEQSFLLIGDSHALVYKSFFDEIGKKRNFSLKTITNNTYPNIQGINRSDFPNEELYNQYTKLADVTNIEIKNSKYIILASSWSDKITSLPSALENFVSKLPKDKKLIILSDFPVLDRNPIKVNRDYIKDKTKNNTYKVEINKLPNYVSSLSKRYPNVSIIDIDYSDLISQIPFHNNIVMYYDEGHLNDYGARIIANKEESQIIYEFNKILEQ
ncbi:acyltransferase family protein [Chryseobacterium paridis]|uniref:Acyltransferase n=1 Tax=Chryseobacterium paridis TaxID=2800328 RepID=A0ABS1FZ45_9FLAO|nr:acyltransferase family protein [Chryseobacterium paridis]MBK1897730.1 acyltransferase [Chryseobacterium paridis]